MTRKREITIKKNMKKFYNRVAKQQWRLTVPNLSFGRSSPNKDLSEPIKCGSYDLEEAQRAYDSRISGLDRVNSETDSSEDSENYHDASAVSERRSEDTNDRYEDADNGVVLLSKSMSGEFQYDVPKISFSFFERNEEEEEETHKSEVKIVLASPETSFEEKDVSEEEITLETQTLDLSLTKDVPLIIKSGSDPNIYRIKEEDCDEGEEDVYKVPSKRLHRLSQSLNDFSIEIEQENLINSNGSSIEHISCSQIIPQQEQQEETMAYCKARSDLPLKLRRVTLLRKPKTKAVDTWINLRSKLNNIMIGDQQKVLDKEKLSMNIEEVYKNSKDRCKRVLKSTGRIFRRNRDDENADNSSRIIRNHAFFANLKASDIEYKLNYANDGPNKNVSEPNSPEKEDVDFGAVKGAFRRSRLITAPSEVGYLYLGRCSSSRCVYIYIYCIDEDGDCEYCRN